jgi:Pyruvate/2-oxoacid:ferredoxin oxidoreductase gamma subunit
MPHLRFGEDPIDPPYYVQQANCIACHSPAYLMKFDTSSVYRCFLRSALAQAVSWEKNSRTTSLH